MIISTEERGTKNIFVPTGIAVGYAWNSTPIDGAYILRSILAIGRELHFLLYVNINVLNANVASPLSSNNSLDTSLHKRLHKKSDNNVSNFWEVFQIKQDSGKTSNKTAYYRDGIPSDNEGRNMLEPSISSYCTEKSRAHKNINLTTMKFLPTDDPT